MHIIEESYLQTFSHSLEDGETVECPYANYEKCNPFCYLSLKCMDDFKKAYSYDPTTFFKKPQFLNCRHYLYYWVFAIKYEEKIFFIMTSYKFKISYIPNYLIIYFVPLPLPSIAITPFSPISFSNFVVFDFPKGIYGAISLIGFSIVLLKSL